MIELPRKDLITLGERALYELKRKAPADQVPTEWNMAAAVVDSIPSRRWYAMACKEYQERRAAEELEKRKVAFYRPKFFRHPDDEDFHHGAMGFRFPGYVLVHIDVNMGEHTLAKHTPGIDDFVKGATGGDEAPNSLPADAVQLFRKFEESDFDRVTLKRASRRDDLFLGCNVLVDDASHHLQGQQGTLMALEAHYAKVMFGMANTYWILDPAILRRVVLPKKLTKEKAA